MAENILKFYSYAHVEALARDDYSGNLIVTLATAAETPAPGQPGKDAGEVVLVTQGEGKLGVVVSLGDAAKLNLESYRRAGGALARWMAKSSVARLGVDLTGLKDAAFSTAFIEGIFLGAFRFDHYKSDRKPLAISIALLAADPAALQAEIERVEIITSAVNLSRNWAHEPANIINPVSLAERVTGLVPQGNKVKVTVFDDQALRDMKAGAIVAVGKGSKTPSRMIILEYGGQDPSLKPVVLVGKALTFDTGGYSIKTTDGIQGMKYDKCGGMTVIATVLAAAELGLKTPVVGVVAAAENMISGESYRPDDILTTLSGKTVEIISTDAEGRLVLADALYYAHKTFQPRAMVDLATLTGAVVVALGTVRAGMMTNNDELAAQLAQSGEAVFERLWRLPLDEEYFRQIKGDDADIKNSGGREGGAIIGGTFLHQFVDDAYPWAHLDIAGVAESSKDLPYCQKGATGFGVRLLLDYLSKLA